MADFRNMLDKAKSGELSPEDLGIAVKAITEGRADGGDLYTVLHVVGRGGTSVHAGAVRKYLRMPEDPMLSRLALQILCDWWGMASQFLPELQEFVTGVDWDTDHEVRDIAVSIAGGHIRRFSGPVGLAAALVRIAEDEGELGFAREGALNALAAALGVPLSDVSSPVSRRVRAGSAEAGRLLTRFKERHHL